MRAVSNSGTNEGEWSDQWQFTTEGTDNSSNGDGAITELAAPALVAPGHASENITSACLEWSAVEGADSYTLHINVEGQPEVQVDVLVEGTHTPCLIHWHTEHPTSGKFREQLVVLRGIGVTGEVYNRTGSCRDC